MGNINTLRMDLQKETHGVWVPYAEDIELKIARWGNERFMQIQQEVFEQRRVTLNAKELTEAQRLDAQKDAAARAILLDWRHVEEDGVAIPYSPEKALEYFRDKELWRFWNFVFMQSLEEANYRKERMEADAKNSGTS